MDGPSAQSINLDTPEGVLKECDAIEAAMRSLKASYENHFLGLDRLPPSIAHKALKKRANELRMVRIQQTALKFRANGLYSRLLTYERLWQRSLQEMENGTYRRDLFKARRRAKDKQVAPAPSPPVVKEPPAELLPEAKLRALHEAFVLAKTKCGEDASKLSPAQLGATLRKQIPELLKKHDARTVEFRVLIKNGKAMLQAVPKK